jgi:hypothetical protein
MKNIFLLLIFSSVHCFAEIPELEQTNQNFRTVYKDVKAKALKKVGPIIISKGDFLVLLYKGQRTEVQYIPSQYHQLKAVDHIPLMLYVLLSTYDNETPFTDNQRKELEKIGQRVKNIEVSLQKMAMEPSLIEIQSQCLIKTSNYLQQLVLEGKINQIQNDSFFREISPLLLAIASEATFFQLDALHEQVQKWKKQIPADDWNRLAAIVMGPSMPRIGEVTMQYFSRLTGKPLEVLKGNYPWINSVNYLKDDIQPSKRGRRIVYAENVASEESALDLLATHIIDEEIGKAFFDDKMRMHCDLLSEAASKRLTEKCDREH